MSTRGSADRLSPAELSAWQGFIRAGARINRALDADMTDRHQVSANDYDVLIQLGLAPQRRLRMTTLAEKVLMSPSGVTRLIAQLERKGLVARERSADDARSVEVTLTTAGRNRLKAANRTHLVRVREQFLNRLSDDQLNQLIDIWNTIDPTLITGDRPSPVRELD